MHRLVLVDTSFMVLRMVQRIVFVGMVYGPMAGILSIPRLAISNIVNGLAAYRALQTFARSRQGKSPVKWDNTDHLEGVGTMPSAGATKQVKVRETVFVPAADVAARLRSGDPIQIVQGLEVIQRDTFGADREMILTAMYDLGTNADISVRSALARVIGFLAWPELTLTLLTLLHDRKWVVRANCAKAMLKFPNFPALMESALMGHDPLVREVFGPFSRAERDHSEGLNAAAG